jgi:hypothetical protein
MAEQRSEATPRSAPPREANPRWRQGFDAVEKEVAPRLETIIRSDQFALAAGLAAHAQHLVRAEAARGTRRLLHLFNLPAGTDVTRILNEIGQLRRQVRELADRLDAEDAEDSNGNDRRPR